MRKSPSFRLQAVIGGELRSDRECSTLFQIGRISDMVISSNGISDIEHGISDIRDRNGTQRSKPFIRDRTKHHELENALRPSAAHMQMWTGSVPRFSQNGLNQNEPPHLVIVSDLYFSILFSWERVVAGISYKSAVNVSIAIVRVAERVFFSTNTTFSILHFSLRSTCSYMSLGP